MGPSGPATSLRGNICWVLDHVAGGEGRGEGESGRWGSGVEGESGEVLGSVGELDEGEGEGWWGGRQGGGSYAGSNSGGAEGHDRWLVEEEPFGLGGKVHRMTSWVEQFLHRDGLL